MTKGKVNALILLNSGGSGGGDKIFVENSTGSDINSGDKVLVTAGVSPKVLGSGFNIANNTSDFQDWGCCFSDNDNAFILYNNIWTKYTYLNNKWTSTNVNNWTKPNNGGFVFFPNGTIHLSASYSDYKRCFLYSSMTTPIPSKHLYLGRYKGKDYVIYRDSHQVYDYDFINNTVGTTILTKFTGSYCGLCYLDEETGEGFSISNNQIITFFYIDDNGAFQVNNEITLNVVSDFRLTTFTGTRVGDYMFFATNYSNKYASNGTANSAEKSSLIVYKIVDNGDGKKSLMFVEDEFKLFQLEDCLVQFDMRNDILTVGTRDNVYAYKFNRNRMVFEELLYTFRLIDNTNQNYCYRLAFSPDMSKAIITLRHTRSTMDVSLFILGKAGWEIVSNQHFNYNSSNSFTGIATGNVDDLGRYEVEMTLPEKLDLKVVTDVNVTEDEIIFEGVL
ncbi:MAG: hypothetical protein E7005_01720 [Alphaproteobacteria bacterium]|nr:hypothetical protein [Alphaproteobacteria bacterium]